MKKRSSIQKQLLLNIIPPLVVTLLLFSYINYRYNKSELEKNIRQQQEQIIGEVESLITYYDYAQNIHEQNFADRMQYITGRLVNEVFNDSLDPATADLYSIARSLDMDTTREFIYIINRNGIIVNTTFKKDYLLDFFKLDEDFRNMFNEIFSSQRFRADRFGMEINTQKIKMYSYQPTRDGKYVVELGFQSDHAEGLISKLDSLTRNISNDYSEIRDIVLELGIKRVPLYRIKNPRYNKVAQEVLAERRSRQLTEQRGGKKHYIDFIFLPVLNSSVYDGFVVMIERDDTREKALINNEIKRFSIATLCTIVPILLLVYFRSRKITRPIKTLAQKASVISGGRLDQRVAVEGNNEVTTLSENFNQMVEKLQESYAGLEQKVRDRTAEISQQKHIIEEKNKEIVDSINYAKRIQDAILPTPSAIDALLPNSFVLYKPKDIVAGDFYWMEHRDNYVMMAAADCTGHGVPGAMVSVVCSGALTRSVKEFGLTEPGKILDKAAELVVETFDRNQSDVKDGMDISLISLRFEHSMPRGSERSNEQSNDRTSKLSNIELHWAGANNPLWILGKNENGGYDPVEIKADKQPIGKFENRKPFTTHRYTVKPGDCIYLFTDGFADQFGGPKGKKFKYSSFQTLLLEIAHQPLQEQRHILDRTFESWKGKFEQTDDVCVIGIKF